MKTSRNLPDSYEVRCRAAEIRKRWSPQERQRRIGLPPDTPFGLRQFILGKPTLSWQSAAGNLGRTAPSGAAK
jgi:hypothetical protein